MAQTNQLNFSELDRISLIGSHNGRSNYKVSVINMMLGDIVARPRISPELNLLQRFDHPNIVKFHGILKTTAKSRSSFMDGGSLSGKHVTNESSIKHRPTNPPGPRLCPRSKIAHNNIQPSNIWVDDSQNNVKIADFSVITHISQTAIGNCWDYYFIFETGCHYEMTDPF